MASAPGVVVYSGWASGYGNVVYIDHGDGYQTRYAHAEALHVKKGDRVNAGHIIGKVGSTGRSSGPHLHFEIRKNGIPINPEGKTSKPKR